MLERVLILDCETTSLDPSDGQCIEIAVVRYSIAARSVIDSRSWLLEADSNPLEHINHIPSALFANNGDDPRSVWRDIESLSGTTGAILAHNADFDRQWVPAEIANGATWIDTCHAVDWPMQSKPGASLISLALDHGLGVVDPHRALNDCLLLARLMTRCAELGHDVSEILARGLRPMATFQALVSFAQKDAAKDAGFHWNAPTKQWLRKMAIEDAATLPFRVANLDNDASLRGGL